MTAKKRFDLEADHSETVDQAAEHPEVVEKMRKMFSDWRKRVYITGKPVN